MRVRPPRSWDNRTVYQGGGRSAPPFPERRCHQPFVFGQDRGALDEHSEQQPLEPPHPAAHASAPGGAAPPRAASDPRIPRARAGRGDAPAPAARPITQRSPPPSPPLEQSRRRGRRTREPPKAVSRASAARRGQAEGKAGGFPVGIKGSAKPYICVGADTPMSDKQSAITERTASHAARRARTSSGATGRPSLGSTWHAA